MHGVSGGAIFLSASSSSGFRLIFEIRPVELNAPTQSCDLLGVASDFKESFVGRVGLVAFKGRDREKGCGRGRSASLAGGGN